MPELGQQLKEYFETAGPPVDVEEVIAGLDRRPPHHRRWLPATVGAAVVVVAAAFVYAVLISQPQPTAPVIGDVRPPTPTVSEQSLPVGRPLVWDPVATQELEIMFGDGATIYASGESGTWYATEDGLAWRRLAGRAPAGALEPRLASAWREHLVFVSEVVTEPEDEQAAVQVAVAQPDGATDQAVLRPRAPSYRTVRPGPVAMGPTGVLVTVEGNNAGKQGDLTGWVSTDFETWTQIPDAGPFTSQVPKVSLEHLVGVDDGFVAIDESGAVWSSRDGLSWRHIAQEDRLAREGGDGVQLMPWRGHAVALGPAGMWSVDLDGISGLPVAGNAPAPVADWGNIGVAAGGAGLAWTVADDTIAYSPDGIVWTLQQLPEDIGTVYAFAGPSMLVGSNSLVLQAQGIWVGR